MTPIFLFFAVVGGTVLVFQFVLTLIGLGSDGDVPDDLPDDVPHDLSLDASHDFSGDGGHGHDVAHAHDSSWLFGIISFRTLVAACAFFGLGGLAASSAGWSMFLQVGTAVVCGAVAMVAVHSLLKMLGKLGDDATVRIHKALGQEGTVYVPIAAGKERAGKVQLKLQNRLMEYEAITAGERLATGVRVRVVAIRGNTLEVEPAGQPAIAKA
jgi:membrane protein implicated in regulation of membrane protease activity